MGVIAPPAGSGQAGFAVIALDGQPARTWRVGAGVDGNTTLLSVSKRGAEFGPPGGPSSFTLQLPEPSAAETGTLNAAVSQPDPSQMQPTAAPTPAPAQFDNPQGGAQPVMPGRGGFQNGRNGPPPRAGRGFQQNGIAPQRPATLPDQPQNDSGAAPQQQ
jgi:general secretion pathway protein C